MIKLTTIKPVWLLYLFLGVIYFLGAAYVAIADGITPVVTHGIAAGDVTPSSGVFGREEAVLDDYTGKVLLRGLEADTAAAIRDINGTIKYQTTLAPVTQH